MPIIWLASPAVSVSYPDTGVTVGFKNPPERGVHMLIDKEYCYAAASNALARMMRASSIRNAVAVSAIEVR